MTVYVDNFQRQFRRMRLCHMLADTLEELHEMADAVELPRKYFQGDHYDLCLQKRDRAVKLGAVLVTSRKLVQVRASFRQRRAL